MSIHFFRFVSKARFVLTLSLLGMCGYKLLTSFQQFNVLLTNNLPANELLDKNSPTNELPYKNLPVKDDECSCRYVGNQTGGPQSTCSDYATARGPGQKIISFSFYGITSLTTGYFKGISNNLALMKKHYPGFIMRVYHNKSWKETPEDMKKFCDIYCSDLQLDLCSARTMGEFGSVVQSFGMVWRFAPMADPLVEEWHCRDLDSNITEREVSAVADWRESGKTVHCMRDNPYHAVSFVGCCFGMRRNEKLAPKLKKSFEQMLASSKDRWSKGLDQSLLDSVVWPLVRKDSLAHDSYSCDIFRGFQEVRPFPTQRKNGPDYSKPDVNSEAGNFVGANGGYLVKRNECPISCRPPEHKDWLLC